MMSLHAQIQTISKQATGFQRNVYIAFICTFFFGFLIFGGAYAVLVNLLLVRLGFGPEFVGLLNGVGRLALAVGSIMGALLGKRLSSSSLLKGGYFLFFIGIFLFPLAGYAPEPLQRGWFLTTYALSFLMGAIFVVHMNPLMMASTNDEERNRVFSYSAALMTIGGFAGSWFAGGISALLIRHYALSVDSAIPYTWTLLAAAALAILGVIATLYIDNPAPMPAPSPAKNAAATAATLAPFPWQIIILVALVMTLRAVGELSVRSFSNLYLDLDFAVDPARIAYIFSVGQLLSVPAPLLAPWLMARYGRGAVFNWATVGVAGCVFCMAFAQHWLWIAVGYSLVLGLAQIARPAITIISMSSMAPKWQASMSSSNIVSIGLSGLATSIMGGWMIGSVGFRPFLLTAVAITLVGVAIFWFNFLKDADATPSV